MCLGFVLSSVLVGGDTYRSVFGNFRGEMVDLGFFFLRRLIFGKGGLERMEKVIFFFFWYDLVRFENDAILEIFFNCKI